MFSLCHYGVFCVDRRQKNYISLILNSGCNTTYLTKFKGCEYFLKALSIDAVYLLWCSCLRIFIPVNQCYLFFPL